MLDLPIVFSMFRGWFTLKPISLRSWAPLRASEVHGAPEALQITDSKGWKVLQPGPWDLWGTSAGSCLCDFCGGEKKPKYIMWIYVVSVQLGPRKRRSVSLYSKDFPLRAVRLPKDEHSKHFKPNQLDVATEIPWTSLPHEPRLERANGRTM